MEETKGERIEEIDISLIDEPPVLLHPETPLEELEELANSIKEIGLIEPIIVRPKGGRYELISGYRRYMAAKKFGIPRLPARIMEVGDKEALMMSATENIQRTDLDPVAEGELYAKLYYEHKLTIEEISKKVGKSHSYVKARIDLLDQPEEIKEMARAGKLKLGIIPHLKKIEDEKERIIVAEDLAKRGFTIEGAKYVIDAFLKYKKEMTEAKTEEVLQRAEEEPMFICEWCKQQKNYKFARSMVICDDCYRRLMFLDEREKYSKSG
mgnify:CR=1 FL=1